MSTPWHPLIVHLPLALAFLAPALSVVCLLLIRRQRWPQSVWWLVVALQVTMTISGYVAMESGEWEETIVERVTGDGPMSAHEERAEMFVSVSVAASALTIVAALVKANLQVPVQLAALVVMLGNFALAWRAGSSGANLVYRHKAPAAYVVQADGEQGSEGLLPTPGMNTSESPYPVEDDHPAPNEEDEPDEEDKVED